MALTDIQIRNTKPGATHRYLTHKKGLQLSVEPSGSHFWRFHYRFNGQMQTLCIGKYPKVSIAEAEQAMEKARAQIESGLNPRELVKIERLENKVKALEAIIAKLHRGAVGKVK